jgi:peptidyl-prolyl cis-trans isomerase D
MLAVIRKFLDTKWAKVFFVLLIVPFVLWGIAGVATNSGSGSTDVAKVGDQAIDATAFQTAYRQLLTQVTRQMNITGDPAPTVKRGVAGQALERLIIQAAIANEVKQLGLVVPDEALRQAVFEIPAFKGRSGTFDKTQFESVLRQNNLTEGRFLQLMRGDIAQRELMESVTAGARAPDELLRQVFAFQHEQRVAIMVELPFTAAAEPPAPTPDDLKRAYEDDPQRYAAPAFRRIKAVVLSPDTIARGIDVPEADIKAYYDAHGSEFGGPEKRSVQVIVAQDEAAAQKLAAAWTAGADWAAMQQQATAAGASAAELDDAQPVDIPSPDLAEAAFKAAPNVVTGPIKSAFGYQVLRVTKITPSTQQPLAAVQDKIKQSIAREKAVDEVYSRANKLEDALSAGTSLDDLPGDLGLAGISGTLDARGDTQDGEPAPIPGSPALRQAIVKAAFDTPKGQPAKMTEGPDQSYFALVVEDETPPATKPFDQVQAQLREDWIADARKKSQEVIAARLLNAVTGGGSLEDAAVVAGLHAERTPPMQRNQANEGVPPALVQPVFGMKLKEGTMVQTPDGFLVAQLIGISSPDIATDPVGAAQMQTALNQSIGQDIEMTFAAALRDREKPTINQQLVDSLIQ